MTQHVRGLNLFLIDSIIANCINKVSRIGANITPKKNSS